MHCTLTPSQIPIMCDAVEMFYREIITGLPDNGVADCMATYVIEDKKIAKVQFLWKPRTDNVKL